eukprot:12889599-Prorocentrum_lima.AAC.1
MCCLKQCKLPGMKIWEEGDSGPETVAFVAAAEHNAECFPFHSFRCIRLRWRSEGISQMHAA